MANTSSHGSTPTQPGHYEPTASMTQFIWVALFLGLLTLGIGFINDPSRTWQAVLASCFFFVSLSLGGLFFTSIQYVTKAGWSVTVRRVSESFSAYLPYAAVSVLAIMFFGAKGLYEWMQPSVVAGDHLIQKKVAYLNPSFFNIRTVVFFALWFIFGKLIVGHSLNQDKTGKEEHTHKNVRNSILFLLTFALSYSLFSIDYLMSLDSKWFSTIFGVYTFAGLFQSSLAFMILVVVSLMNRGLLRGFVNENHLHDLGKLMFAFTVFYAYIAFSQFMLIWYANLPEETFWYTKRAGGGWLPVAYALIVLKFILPFFLLLPRAAKRNPGHLVRMSVVVLIAQYVDIYWLIYPNFYKSPVLPIYDIGIFLGFLGLFLMSISKFLSKHSLVPMKDPRLHEALHHHI